MLVNLKLLNELSSSNFELFSAGSHPSQVHPMSIAVMEEIGIDISKHTSDHIDDYLDKNINIVITVCDNANNVCPNFPGNVNWIHWSIDDPFRNWNFDLNQLSAFRETREEIKLRLLKFIQEYK
jgi:arsenate reductase